MKNILKYITTLIKKRELKGKKQKQNTALPDFVKPDFSQVM